MSEYDVTLDKVNLKPMITLFKAYQALTRIVKDDIKKFDFDLNEFAVLEVMFHHDQLKVNEINDKVLVNSSSLTYILDKLVKKGLIIRIKDEIDKRSFNIQMTKEGKILGSKIFPTHYSLLTEVFNVLDEEEKATLCSLLKKVGKHASSYSDDL